MRVNQSLSESLANSTLRSGQDSRGCKSCKFEGRLDAYAKQSKEAAEQNQPTFQGLERSCKGLRREHRRPGRRGTRGEWPVKRNAKERTRSKTRKRKKERKEKKGKEEKRKEKKRREEARFGKSAK